VRGLKHSVLSCREWLYQRCQRRKKSQRTAARQQFAIRAHERELLSRLFSSSTESQVARPRDSGVRTFASSVPIQAQVRSSEDANQPSTE